MSDDVAHRILQWQAEARIARQDEVAARREKMLAAQRAEAARQRQVDAEAQIRRLRAEQGWTDVGYTTGDGVTLR